MAFKSPFFFSRLSCALIRCLHEAQLVPDAALAHGGRRLEFARDEHVGKGVGGGVTECCCRWGAECRIPDNGVSAAVPLVAA